MLVMFWMKEVTSTDDSIAGTLKTPWRAIISTWGRQSSFLGFQSSTYGYGDIRTLFCCRGSNPASSKKYRGKSHVEMRKGGSSGSRRFGKDFSHSRVQIRQKWIDAQVPDSLDNIFNHYYANCMQGTNAQENMSTWGTGRDKYHWPTIQLRSLPFVISINALKLHLKHHDLVVVAFCSCPYQGSKGSPGLASCLDRGIWGRSLPEKLSAGRYDGRGDFEVLKTAERRWEENIFRSWSLGPLMSTFGMVEESLLGTFRSRVSNQVTVSSRLQLSILELITYYVVVHGLYDQIVPGWSPGQAAFCNVNLTYLVRRTITF